MKIELRVKNLEEKVDNHEKRLSLIESKFDFIKNCLLNITEDIKDINPKKYKIVIYVLLGLVIGCIIAGAIK